MSTHPKILLVSFFAKTTTRVVGLEAHIVEAAHVSQKLVAEDFRVKEPLLLHCFHSSDGKADKDKVAMNVNELLPQCVPT